MSDAARSRAPTLNDVAREAGVSLATASRALNGSSRRVGDGYRARVLAVAERLGYAPNPMAQAVARGRASSIGVVVSDINDPYFSAIAGGILRAAEAAGLGTAIAVSERDPEKELGLVGMLSGHRHRGLVLVGSRSSDAEASGLLAARLHDVEAKGGHVALVSQDTLPFDTVAFDNVSGAHALAERIAAFGYREITILGAPEDLLTSGERISGFRAGLAAAGVDPEAVRIVRGSFTRDGGYAAAGEALAAGRPQLLFAVNDVMAVGAMARLRAEGLEPGRDVAVAGFDDIETLRDISPALSTVRLPLAEGGEAAIEMILRGKGVREVRRMPAEVVVRASTPPLR